MPTGKDDLSTLYTAHLVVLRAVNTQNANDASTALALDVQTVEQTIAPTQPDVNEDYFVYLQTNP